jgi:hypothetical protein
MGFRSRADIRAEIDSERFQRIHNLLTDTDH